VKHKQKISLVEFKNFVSKYADGSRFMYSSIDQPDKDDYVRVEAAFDTVCVTLSPDRISFATIDNTCGLMLMKIKEIEVCDDVCGDCITIVCGDNNNSKRDKKFVIYIAHKNM